MKYYISIAEKHLLSTSHRKTWLAVSDVEEKETECAEILKETEEEIKTKFPELPNKMVWGHYLIFNHHGSVLSIDIDYDDIEAIKREILEIALRKDLMALIGSEDKIYKDIEDIN
ncbi:hypothetical protein GCM10022216_32620 [Sphingobacterium kyonggiense]|uniref:Uncharacterized protein n=1 Tax=Sphingobacterium kyonggiense TaxID=714075 RepID=A0ABP7Z460_9SPHI